jgi:purine-binding chemotaxis protein CheW
MTTILPYIDWRALLSDLDPDNRVQQQRLQERLRQRARQYAAANARAEALTEEEADAVLTFRLGSEHYALDVTCVQGVRPVTRMTRVPGVPAFYRGVVNIRGQVLSVLDLRDFFNVGMSDEDAPGEIILTAAGQLTLALLAHHIEDVISLPKTAVQSAEMRYARGITQERMIVLDLEQLFTDERLIIGGGDD